MNREIISENIYRDENGILNIHRKIRITPSPTNEYTFSHALDGPRAYNFKNVKQIDTYQRLVKLGELSLKMGELNPNVFTKTHHLRVDIAAWTNFVLYPLNIDEPIEYEVLCDMKPNTGVSYTAETEYVRYKDGEIHPKI